MTWRLDPPVRVGRRLFAALTQVEISAHGVGSVVMASAGKAPLVILMRDGDTVTALDLDGRTQSPQDTAQAYRDAVAQLRAHAAAQNDPDQ